jgi:hypothetical protein
MRLIRSAFCPVIDQSGHPFVAQFSVVGSFRPLGVVRIDNRGKGDFRVTGLRPGGAWQQQKNRQEKAP